ncbi:hypothetical protein F5B22DRAFT_623324 [Xylaria bambusicola]|uniref:uncharacterized protein n=1 Tax=Xylaria bambusicola TaxID=326684 RepID=UPI0020088814|nr:uncharacterized protein F5B22DRAFT_623324 [Xylaria bambusicola]KAI0506500.1 hypothetical protein F5B22DRAFT_623324 [Xylaria bambusicola]
MTETITIPSKFSYEDTQKAVEAAIPPLDLTFQTHVANGDYAAARAALEALPPLNNFVLPPRSFTGPLKAIGASGQSVQYEIGNPLTAVTMAQHNLDIGLHTPRRVLVRVEGDKVVFKYNLIAPLVAKYNNAEVNDTATKLDARITKALRQIGGDDSSG